MKVITLTNFTSDNLPIEEQVENLGKFLMENFEDEFEEGEGAIEMAVRLLLKLKIIKNITINKTLDYE